MEGEKYFGQFKDEVTSLCMRTVGYAEAQDKTSYLIGVHTAIDKLAEIVDPVFKAKEDRLKWAIQDKTRLRGDLITLARIIKQYTP